ncbi:hypothetical protein BBP40_011706 [Aspergillus hancockii]|nr:hypothetical protein BBP40_011706 [Aspergillus hancockii]
MSKSLMEVELEYPGPFSPSLYSSLPSTFDAAEGAHTPGTPHTPGIQDFIDRLSTLHREISSRRHALDDSQLDDDLAQATAKVARYAADRRSEINFEELI